jgi:hypothetical protein
MKSWKKPTPEQVDRAVALLAHGEHNRHFFDRLENPQWLIQLEEKGFFKSPPPPIRDEPRGAVAFPAWPQSRYLARMAKVLPEAVADVIARIPSTENIRVHDDFAQAALSLPARLAVAIATKAIGWIQSPYGLLLPENAGALIGHLARGGELEASLALAKALLAVRPDPRMSPTATEENRFLFPEPEPLFDLWNYEQILQRNIPELVLVIS